MGFLRFVLESDGYEVVAQASSASELARVLALHQPDVVVLDDGIGATAVQMTHEVSPNAKVILVWPGAVVPIGGYARVDPGDVLRSLGPTVARAVGTMPVPRENVITPGWADRLKKDPAALREKLEEHDGPSTKRPSVTDLQRRGQHLHPVGDTEPAATAPLVSHVGDVRDADEDLAPVLPLSALSMPPAAWASTLPESALEPITAGTAEPPTAAGEWNRRLGTIALGGAVAASAVVVALALGGAGGNQGILNAAGFVQRSPAAVIPAPGASLAGATGQPNLFIGTTGLIPIPPSGPVAPGNGGPHGGGGGTGPRGTGGGGTGGGGGGTGGGGVSSMPGRSALHNPFGGPPGQSGSHVKASKRKGHHGKSGAAHDHASHRGKSGQHASQNGLDHRNKH
jgi:hypothetical protein